MHRVGKYPLVFVLFLLVLGSVTVGEDDDEFTSESQQDTHEVKSSDSIKVSLPRTLTGTVIDLNGDIVSNAIVKLRIIHDDNPFDDASDSEDAQEWVATTQDDGSYKLSLGVQVLTAEDSLILKVTKEGFLESVKNFTAKQAAVTTLPPHRLKPLRAGSRASWENWSDDTEAYNQQVAAIVNGEPILKGLILSRYAGYLVSCRETMQTITQHGELTQALTSPKGFEEFREALIDKELPKYIEKTALAQFIASQISPEELAENEDRIEELFTEELEKLQKELDVSNLEDLKSKLEKKHVSLKQIKQDFVLDHPPLEQTVAKFLPADPIGTDEVRHYYESHLDDFKLTRTVDWREICIEDTSIIHKQKLKELIEEILDRLQQGYSYEDVMESLVGTKEITGRTYAQMNDGSLVDKKLEAKLFSMPLNEWSDVIEKQIMWTETKSATPKPTSTTPGATDSAAESLSDGANVLINVIQADPKTPNTPEKNATTTHSEKGSVFCLVIVTDRKEAGFKPIDDVESEIRESISKEQYNKRLRKMMLEVFGRTQVETNYAIPDEFKKKLRKVSPLRSE